MLKAINKRRSGFTLVEIMIVVAIIALLAAIAVPGFLRSRKRAQGTSIKNDLRLLDQAIEMYAIENNKITGAPVGVTDWQAYLKRSTTLYELQADVFGDAYGAQTVDTLPRIPANAKSVLSDVCDTAFWTPYQ